MEYEYIYLQTHTGGAIIKKYIYRKIHLLRSERMWKVTTLDLDLFFSFH